MNRPIDLEIEKCMSMLEKESTTLGKQMIHQLLVKLYSVKSTLENFEGSYKEDEEEDSRIDKDFVVSTLFNYINIFMDEVSDIAEDVKPYNEIAKRTKKAILDSLRKLKA